MQVIIRTHNYAGKLTHDAALLAAGNGIRELGKTQLGLASDVLVEIPDEMVLLTIGDTAVVRDGFGDIWRLFNLDFSVASAALYKRCPADRHALKMRLTLEQFRITRESMEARRWAEEQVEKIFS